MSTSIIDNLLEISQREIQDIENFNEFNVGRHKFLVEKNQNGSFICRNKGNNFYFTLQPEQVQEFGVNLSNFLSYNSLDLQASVAIILRDMGVNVIFIKRQFCEPDHTLSEV